MRKFTLFAALVASLVVALGISGPASAQNNSHQVGLVNVSVGNVAILNDANIAVAANVIAAVCGNNIPIGVLAAQVVVDGSETFCTATTPVTVTQSGSSAQGSPNAGGNNSRQFGLVNVSLGNVDILNNVNLAVAANVVALVCGNNIPVGVLATQLIAGDGETTCTGTGTITITQEQK